jgi:hypothetical protein
MGVHTRSKAVEQALGCVATKMGFCDMLCGMSKNLYSKYSLREEKIQQAQVYLKLSVQNCPSENYGSAQSLIGDFSAPKNRNDLIHIYLLGSCPRKWAFGFAVLVDLEQRWKASAQLAEAVRDGRGAGKLHLRALANGDNCLRANGMRSCTPKSRSVCTLEEVSAE